MHWSIELGRIDLAHSGAVMSKIMMASSRQGHLVALVKIFAYIQKPLWLCIVFDPNVRDWSSYQWSSHDWSEFYPGLTEAIPPNMPTPYGYPVQINMFCDAAHAVDLLTRCSTTGIVIFINGSPIRWFSKAQNTIESSTFGSEFVALKIATELNKGIRYKLRMFGIPIDGPTNTFCDNNSVVQNVTRPESVLQKKHNCIAYHKVRESVTSQAMRILHEPGNSNLLADVLTNLLPPAKHMACCKCMLWWSYCPFTYQGY